MSNPAQPRDAASKTISAMSSGFRMTVKRFCCCDVKADLASAASFRYFKR